MLFKIEHHSKIVTFKPENSAWVPVLTSYNFQLRSFKKSQELFPFYFDAIREKQSMILF